MRQVTFLIVAIALALGVGFYMTFSTGETKALKAVSRASDPEMIEVKELMASGEYHEALQHISRLMRTVEPNELAAPELVQQAVIAYAEIGDLFNLVGLFELYPDAFESQEKASLIVANVFAQTKEELSYEAVRNQWRGRETQRVHWLLVDADALIAAGEGDRALRILESSKFEGADEVERLIRIARVRCLVDVDAAWKILDEAIAIKPDHPELHAWRGRIAEYAKNIAVAQTEFVTALQVDPVNPVRKDELAEFYRRYGQYGMALQVWASGLERPSADVIWLKTLFWNRVTTPLSLDWDSLDAPGGLYGPLVDYVLDVPKEQFWDEATYAQLDKGGMYARRRQETYWLRLMQYLKEGKEERALLLLNLDPHKGESYHSEVEAQLRRIINYRVHGVFSYETDVEAGKTPFEPRFTEREDRHQFFEDLNALADKRREEGSVEVPDTLARVLKSPDVYTAVFMAADWIEAAILLHTMPTIPGDFPDWMAFGITQCLRQNRGNDHALAFALRQVQTPALSLIVGEMYANTGSSDAALDTFKVLMDGEDPQLALRAGWTASSLLIKQREFEAARQLIQGNEQLRNDRVGKEALARMAMMQGDEEEADRLYGALEDVSIEAKSYLARRAFALGQWKRARELTEELVLKFPAHQVLQQNLKQIIYAERAAEQEAQQQSTTTE